MVLYSCQEWINKEFIIVCISFPEHFCLAACCLPFASRLHTLHQCIIYIKKLLTSLQIWTINKDFFYVNSQNVFSREENQCKKTSFFRQVFHEWCCLLSCQNYIARYIVYQTSPLCLTHLLHNGPWEIIIISELFHKTDQIFSCRVLVAQFVVMYKSEI